MDGQDMTDGQRKSEAGDLIAAARAFERALNVAGADGMQATVYVHCSDVSTIERRQYAYTLSIAATETRHLYPC